MANFYYLKILNHVINSKTGIEWTVDDVPKLWREKVREIIETENNEN